MSLWFIIFIIFIALVFDFTNGMHDAANSISTVVSTRVLFAPAISSLPFRIIHFHKVSKGCILQSVGNPKRNHIISWDAKKI